MKCASCGSAAVERRSEDHVIRFDGRRFTGRVTAEVCRTCGESLVALDELARVELETARTLGDAGLVSSKSFRFMRHALGLTARELALDFSVAPETISRWENEERPLDRLAWVTLAAMVRDRLEGSERTRDQLSAARAPTRLARTIRLDT
jgi:putative zinc finger/helix-turn-helix YgiT family protein